MEVRSDICNGFISRRFCETANHTIPFKVRLSANICFSEFIVIRKASHESQLKGSLSQLEVSASIYFTGQQVSY